MECVEQDDLTQCGVVDGHDSILVSKVQNLMWSLKRSTIKKNFTIVFYFVNQNFTFSVILKKFEIPIVPQQLQHMFAKQLIKFEKCINCFFKIFFISLHKNSVSKKYCLKISAFIIKHNSMRWSCQGTTVYKLKLPDPFVHYWFFFVKSVVP